MKDKAIIMTICFSILIILIYKLYLYYKKKKDMINIRCRVTDTTYKTGYAKNTYIYYYIFTYNNEEYTTNDATRVKLPFFDPKIKDEFDIFINPNKPNNNITPLEIYKVKFYSFLITLLIIISILLLF